MFLFIIRLLGTRFLFLVFRLLSSPLLLVRHCPHFPYVKEVSGRQPSLFAVLTLTTQLVFIEVTFPYILNLFTNLGFFLRNTADQMNCSESARAESARLSLRVITDIRCHRTYLWATQVLDYTWLSNMIQL